MDANMIFVAGYGMSHSENKLLNPSWIKIHMNSNNDLILGRKRTVQKIEKGGNPYVISSLRDLFEVFRFGAWLFIGLQLISVVVLTRFATNFFGLDPFVVGGIFVAYCMTVDAMAFFTKFGMHYSIHQRAAIHVCCISVLPVGLLELANRLIEIVKS